VALQKIVLYMKYSLEDKINCSLFIFCPSLIFHGLCLSYFVLTAILVPWVYATFLAVAGFVIANMSRVQNQTVLIKYRVCKLF